MRRWLAVLAFVPVVAWGQVVDCNAERAKMYQVVDQMREIKAQGATKRDVIEHAAQQEDIMVRDALIEAADGVYSSLGFSDDDIVESLHIVCMEHRLRQMRNMTSDR